MKRLGVTVAAVAMMVVMTAGQALAQYPPSKPPPAGPGNGNAVPFTGTNITLGVVILIALLVVGTLLLLLGRRRRVRASS
ncbi:MAG: hypothetical protein ACRDHO_13300 [Actinomycetota bacterium]